MNRVKWEVTRDTAGRLETTHMTDVWRKQGAQRPASGSAETALGTGVHGDAAQGPAQRKKLGDSRAMQNQANSKEKEKGKQIQKTEPKHTTVI